MEYLRAQHDAERRANDENRRLLAGIIERVPVLEAADTLAPTQANDTDAEAAEEGGTPSLPGALGVGM